MPEISRFYGIKILMFKELRLDWELAQSNQKPHKIAPLY